MDRNESLAHFLDSKASVISFSKIKGEPCNSDRKDSLVTGSFSLSIREKVLEVRTGAVHNRIAIDGIEVDDLDYIAIGNPRGTTEVIPITIRSLMFS